MTDNTRALLEQVLKALEYHTRQTRPIQKTEHAILAIHAELAKPVEPQKTNVFGITTAYEQGVGKGHQSKVRGEIACPYAEGDYAQAWNLGYTEGKEQADRLQIEPAKPVEQVEPITLEQFRAIAHRTGTTYRHRSDPEKSSYAFVDGSSLDDFWRKVCEAIQPTSAWHDAPTCDGLWVCNEGDDNPYRWTTHSVKFPISPLLVGEDERWFGPIPQDVMAEGDAIKKGG